MPLIDRKKEARRCLHVYTPVSGCDLNPANTISTIVSRKTVNIHSVLITFRHYMRGFIAMSYLILIKPCEVNNIFMY